MKLVNVTLGPSLILIIVNTGVAATNSDPRTDFDFMQRARGGGIYVRECTGCHGASGKGASGPVLRKKRWTVAAVQKIVAAGRPPKMPAFRKKLSAAEMKAVAVYVSKLGTTPKPPRTTR